MIEQIKFNITFISQIIETKYKKLFEIAIFFCHALSWVLIDLHLQGIVQDPQEIAQEAAVAAEAEAEAEHQEAEAEVEAEAEAAVEAEVHQEEEENEVVLQEITVQDLVLQEESQIDFSLVIYQEDKMLHQKEILQTYFQNMEA